MLRFLTGHLSYNKLKKKRKYSNLYKKVRKMNHRHSPETHVHTIGKNIAKNLNRFMVALPQNTDFKVNTGSAKSAGCPAIYIRLSSFPQNHVCSEYF